MKRFHAIRVIFLLASAMLLTACSGGGGTVQTSSTLVSGVAATGVPVPGTVTLKDKTGVLRGPATVDTEGNFSFDVGNLTPPFILKAEWPEGAQTHRLFSVAFRAGNVNINPLSDLALLLATGIDPAAVFGATDAPPATAGITETSLTEAVAQIKTLLSVLLDDYGITDFEPITGNYTASPDNRLDAMLDVIAFETVNGVLTIRNKLDNAVIASRGAANLASVVLNMSKAPDESTLTDIKDITDRVGLLCSVMNLGTSLTAADLEDLFVPDPNYGTSNGFTRAQDVASIVAIFGAGGSNTNGKLKTIRNVRLVSDQRANYSGRGVSKVYLLNYDFIHENGVVFHGNNVTFGKETTSGLWKFIGDPVNATIGSNYGGVFVTGYFGGVSGNIYGVSDTWPPGTVIVPWSYGNAFNIEGSTTIGLWKVVKNGNIVEISYQDQEVFTKIAEFNLDTSALRLRNGAASGWSPAMLLRPSFQGERTDYLGAPVSCGSGQVIENNINISYQWKDEGTSDGVGMIQLSPPGSSGITASVQIIAVSEAAAASRFLLLTLLSDPIPAELPADQSVSIDASTIPITGSGWFIEPPLSGRVLTLNGGTTASGVAAPAVSVSFEQNMAISGQVVATPGNQSAVIKLYVESAQYYGDIGMAEGLYTLTIEP